jgi:NAD(P)-dependent dehydrogenase (short-subunit alcohol dehydrogenase family)
LRPRSAALANAPAVIYVVTLHGVVSSHAQDGLGFVPDYQALSARDETERRRREAWRMELSVAGKRALVTGASGGLGLHFAQVLAEAGAEVTLAARRLDRVEAEADALRAAGFAAEAVALDVTSQGSIVELFEGSPPFHVLINNAGIAGEGAALDMKPAAFQRVIDTNLTGVFTVAQAAARGMREVGGGSIVNIASILGLRVAGHVAAYAASKAAVVQLTKALALEWARFGVRVNALCPGYIETPINGEFFASDAGKALVRRIPQRRLGRVEDLDAPLLLLASDRSAYMTGAVIAVDGGHLVSGL